MNTTIKALSTVLMALSLFGCPADDAVEVVDPAVQDVACLGAPIPGAQLILGRTTGTPNTGSMQLPALTAVCLKVETNTASGDVYLDEAEVFHESEFKNKEQVLYRTLEGLESEQHLVTAEIRSTPEDHYMKVTAYYATPFGNIGPGIGSVDEALLLGQAYIDAHSSVPTFSSWEGAKAIRVTPLYSLDETLQAYEIDIANSEGDDAGYLVLEVDEMRPLLGAAWVEGPALSDLVAQKYQMEYEGSYEEGKSHRFLWADLGVMGLWVLGQDDTENVVQTCENYECPGLTFESQDRPIVDYEGLGLSQEEWLEKRQGLIDAILGKLLEAPFESGPLTPDSIVEQGFFGVSEENTNRYALGGQEQRQRRCA